MKRLLFALACACSFSVPVLAAGVDPSAVPEAVKTITAREIGGHLRFLASDLMKGRDTASPEARVAAEYLAAHLFAAGADPLGDSEAMAARISRASRWRSSRPWKRGLSWP